MIELDNLTCPICGRRLVKILSVIELLCNKGFVDKTDFSGPFWESDNDAYCAYTDCSFEGKVKDFVC